MEMDAHLKPHVLFVNRVFPPDSGGTSQLLGELTLALAGRGWRVSVVAGRSGATADHHAPCAAAVHRSWGIPYRQRPLWYRALAYLSLYPSLLWACRKAHRPDVIVVMSDPPLFVAAAVRFALRRRIPIVHWSQDVYPELAFAMGVVRKDSLIGRLLSRARDKALERCSAVVAIGRCMADALEKRCRADIRVVPNWCNVEDIQPMPHAQNPFRTSLVRPGEQIVMYSGNFGIAHPFDAILNAMAEFEQRRPNVKFVMIGDGPRLPSVKEGVEARGLANVIFLPLQPFSELTRTLGAADIHLACMDPNLCGLLVPSKVYNVLAAGRACLYMGPEQSEAALLIAQTDAGEVLSPDRQHELVARLCHWLDRPDALEEAGRKARQAAERLNLSQAADMFDDLLRNVAGTRPVHFRNAS